ncbi:MAG: hypothetical protein CVV27_07990 [Candidatus Melainabacteria bacterium HGW-Melainabacteria-1]|nr:MAG: hypothetical protein CVV27_07990 [Candidatus Melainabacteria bacterium HGW-Melainabacteria-1]
MVARLRGRPSPRPPGPSEPEEEAGKPGKSGSGSQRLLVAVTVFSLLAATAATGTLVYFTYGPGSRQAALSADLPTADTGPLMELGPFIVNLGDINERRYLRVAISLDFQTRDPAFVNANENARLSWISGLKSDLKHKEAVFKDVVLTTLSAKQPAILGTGTGKESLKAELIARFNRHMSTDTLVRDVYFTDFVIQ